jgi:hypothetical protein
MQPITGELPLKRKRIRIKWLKPIRLSPITDGKTNNWNIGRLEYWNDGFKQEMEKAFVIPQYSINPLSIIPKLFHR